MIALALVLGVLSGCPCFEDSDNSSSSGGTRTFYALDFENGEAPYQLSADLYGVSPSALVYVESGRTAAASAAQAVANEFDRAIYGMVRSNYGTESDFDQNGRVIVLLLDIKDGFSGIGGYIAGYFDPKDMFATDASNRADMIYIDVDPAGVGSDTFFRTVSHEFQHLVNFVENYFREDRGLQDTWINEGLSLSAEYMYAGSHSQGRIDYYNADPAGSMALGNNFFVWDNGDVLADYATAYIFFQWLRIHADNGAGIYRDIIASSQNDYQAVEAAAASRIPGAAASVDGLIRDWYLALRYLDDAGIYGFGGDSVLNQLTYHMEDTNDSSINLAPGEGVFNDTDGSFEPTDPDPQIGYAGLGANSSAVDTEGPVYSGDPVLVWNTTRDYDPDEPAPRISAPISTSVADPGPSSQTPTTGGTTLSGSSAAGTGAPLIYPIGVRRRMPFDDEMERDGQ
ncbi:MAG: hypothetical protein PF508_13625 [Spirochaeta sp.]|nr:hypothetical protein [Spirochaeta sp.]